MPLFLLALFAVVGIGLAMYGNLTGVHWSVRTYLIRTAIGTAGRLFREHYDGGGTSTYSGTYRLKEGYASAPRLQLTNDYAIHHVMSDNPTLYRETWGFYYVFRSPRYGNMFFRKVRWWED